MQQILHDNTVTITVNINLAILYKDISKGLTRKTGFIGLLQSAKRSLNAPTTTLCDIFVH